MSLPYLVPYATGDLHAPKQTVSEREVRMRTVVDNIAEGIITLDEGGVIESFNAAASAIFGYTPEEAIGLNITRFMPPEMRERHENGMRRYLRSGVGQILGKKGVELPGLTKDGTVFRLELAINEMVIGDRLLFVGIVRDISERKQAEADLFQEKERLRVTLNSIADAVITTDVAGNVTYMNPVAQSMTGWNALDATSLPLAFIFNIVGETSADLLQDPVANAIRNELVPDQDANTELIRKDASRMAIEKSCAPIRDAEGEVIGVVIAFRDVTLARQMTAQLSHHATHDELTGLINRREFETRLQRLLDNDSRGARLNTLLYFDLDQFKVVNDTCGHVAGDELLRQLAGLLQFKLRQCDTLARLGGDEFGVLLENCTEEHGRKVAETLRRAAADFRFSWDDKIFAVGISIGLIAFGGDFANLPDILRMADAACYMAKGKGRNRIHSYSPEDHELNQRHGEISWLSRVKEALEQDRFVLYSQKIVSMKPDADLPEHHELLIRMVEKDGKLTMPGAFIPAAERYGLMGAVDRWVVAAAFRALHENPTAAQQNVIYAINLSGATLSDETFLDFVLAQFRSCDVRPGCICFEITETSAIANLSAANALIKALKAIGCQFSLDDFGSGMSSFAYLKHLPVDFLKIDGGFVRGIVEDPIDYAMVESINRIGHLMGIRTIAEFAESGAIVKCLEKIGVDMAQGYFIEKPRPLAW